MMENEADAGILSTSQAQVAVDQTERHHSSEKHVPVKMSPPVPEKHLPMKKSHYKNCTSPKKHFPMKFSHDVNCKSSEDRVEGRIAAMAVLADGRLVVYDEPNKKLKAFSKNGRSVVLFGDEIRNCRDITAVEHKNRFAITEDDKTVIRHFSIKEKLIKEKKDTISLPGRGYHCKYKQHHYCVTCDVTDSSSRSLAIINEKGHPRCLKIPDIEVSQIAMHPQFNEVYLSDYKNQTIFCVHFDKHNLSISPLQKLDCSPFGICVVTSSYLLVCDAEIGTVLKIKLHRGSKENAGEEVPDVKCSKLISSHPQNSLVYMTSVSDGIIATAFKINSEKVKYEEFDYEL